MFDIPEASVYRYGESEKGIPKGDNEMAKPLTANGTDGDTLEVKVIAPGIVEPRDFSFRKNLSVGEAAAEAAATLGFQANSPSFQKGDEVLDRNKRLVAAGVRDGDLLELVDVGGGV